jgi:hypothetical protein
MNFQNQPTTNNHNILEKDILKEYQKLNSNIEKVN